MNKQTQATQVERIKELEDAVRDMDMYSQEGFRTADALLSLVETALTVPETYTRSGIGNIFTVLRAARYVCTDMGNCTNGVAERAGHNFVDRHMHERSRACMDGLTKALEGGAA